MMQPLELHRVCLSNARRYHAEMRARIVRDLDLLEKAERADDAYAAQIERAEREGRDGFDRDKYGKPHRARGER